MARKSFIYTRTGDAGLTGLLGGSRVPKDDSRIEVVGSLDELNAIIGVAAAQPVPKLVVGVLAKTQHLLFEIGAELADPKPKKPSVTAAHVEELEHVIDELDAQLPTLDNFIIPGGSEMGSRLHLTRAVCRRAERAIITLSRKAPVNPEIMRYLNRLGDALFVMARFVNKADHAPEIHWKQK
ncbi:cob(I)yrinic acid a,c-diamide adenosyltransferase [Candidatus Berkelbacteria bacterium]|nr:cob(I)yrinic acid a,c-diamide adenosyltransferase [Candidatus Berkelbacteria bacterium]